MSVTTIVRFVFVSSEILINYMHYFLAISLQVVYVTATVPFVFLGIMFVRGVTLDGAAEGMRTFVSPDFGKLLSFQVSIT